MTFVFDDTLGRMLVQDCRPGKRTPSCGRCRPRTSGRGACAVGQFEARRSAARQSLTACLQGPFRDYLRYDVQSLASLLSSTLSSVNGSSGSSGGSSLNGSPISTGPIDVNTLVVRADDGRIASADTTAVAAVGGPGQAERLRPGSERAVQPRHRRFGAEIQLRLHGGAGNRHGQRGRGDRVGNARAGFLCGHRVQHRPGAGGRVGAIVPRPLRSGPAR